MNEKDIWVLAIALLFW